MKVRFVSKATYINITAKGLMLQPDISHDVHYVNPFFRPGGDTRRNAKRAVERAAKMQQEVEKIKRYYSQKGESVICPALPGPYTGRSGPRFWLADTGCRFDLIGETEISDEVLAGRKISDRAISLKTANSGVTANEVIPMSVPVIDENIEPLLLKSTPAVLSVGTRCMHRGYGFWWPPYEAPIWYLPNDGGSIRLTVRNDCPYLDVGDEACPASYGGSSASTDVAIPPPPKVEQVPANSAGQPVAEGSKSRRKKPLQADTPVHLDGTVDLRAEANSIRHLMRHYPKNPYCDACQRARIQTKGCYKKRVDDEIPARFGVQVTADHIILNSYENVGLDLEQAGLTMFDRGTKWLEIYPVADKSTAEAFDAFNQWQGANEKIETFYSDNSPELLAAAKLKGWRHTTSTAGEPATNGVIEQKNRMIIGGATTSLERAGFPAKWWPYATKHFCMASNIEIVDGDSPWNLRHGKGQFKGLRLPFGCLVDFKPMKTREQESAKFDPKAVPGIFLGYKMHPGGTWRGEYVVAELHEFDDMDDVNNGRVSVQTAVREVHFPKDEKVVFPLKDRYDKIKRTLPDHADRADGDSVDESPADSSNPKGAVPDTTQNVGERRETDEAQQTEDEQNKPKQRGVGSANLFGINIRNYKGSTRPPDIFPMEWTAMSKKQKLEKIAQYAAKRTALEEAAQKEGKPPSEVSAAAIFKPHDRVDAFLEMVLKGCCQPDPDPPLVLDYVWPAMPCTFNEKQQSHRDKLSPFSDLFECCVARTVTKKELKENKKAQQAVQKEWDKLRGLQTWDESRVREWSDVAKEARKTGQKVNVGLIFQIVVEKGSELEEGNPLRKFKGRVVFQGNNVRDENAEYAIFSELSSAPASMQAAKHLDAYGLLPGHATQLADAESAYTQSRLKGTPTWVRMPREQWPAEWVKAGLKDPVCPLILALYGHPDAGGYWERHCEEHLFRVGFKGASTWRSTFWHKELRLLLTVYVDDFKMSGPAGNLAKGWELIRQPYAGLKGIKMDDPTPGGKFLGCDHIESRQCVIPTQPPTATGGGQLPSILQDGSFSKVVNSSKQQLVPVRVLEYDMSLFLQQCVERYQELAGPNGGTLRKVDTPFLAEKLETPMWEDKDKVPEGNLKSIAAKVLMKILYAARMARYDLLRPTCALASLVTKWTPKCDRALHRLVSYINCTLDRKMIAWVGDMEGDLQVRLFSDADFAGDESTMRSTSGVFMALKGPNTSFPLAGTSKKQTAVSHSTPEAEIVAADLAVRAEGLPSLDLWELVLDRRVQMTFEEDNQTAIRVIETGKSETMRHMGRTHKVDIAWLHERFLEGSFQPNYIDTAEQAADIFTKALPESKKWEHACNNIAHVYPKAIWPDYAKSIIDTAGKEVEKTTPSKANEKEWDNLGSPMRGWRQPDQIVSPTTTLNNDKATKRVATSSKEVSASAEQEKTTKKVDRQIVEFCCGNNSILGTPSKQSRGCGSIRITQQIDARSAEGIQMALKAVETPNTLLWAAMPCTGGSTWQRLNIKRRGVAKKIRAHIRLFNQLFIVFKRVATHALKHNNHVAIEWPRHCSYWKLKKVYKLFKDLGLETALFDGCALGIISRVDGRPIRKPWRVDSSCTELVTTLNKHRCPGHREHAPCQGQDTKATENYSKHMAAVVHNAWRRATKQEQKEPCACCVELCEAFEAQDASLCPPTRPPLLTSSTMSSSSNYWNRASSAAGGPYGGGKKGKGGKPPHEGWSGKGGKPPSSSVPRGTAGKGREQGVPVRRAPAELVQQGQKEWGKPIKWHSKEGDLLAKVELKDKLQDCATKTAEYRGRHVRAEEEWKQTLISMWIRYLRLAVSAFYSMISPSGDEMLVVQNLDDSPASGASVVKLWMKIPETAKNLQSHTGLGPFEQSKLAQMPRGDPPERTRRDEITLTIAGDSCALFRSLSAKPKSGKKWITPIEQIISLGFVREQIHWLVTAGLRMKGILESVRGHIERTAKMCLLGYIHLHVAFNDFIDPVNWRMLETEPGSEFWDSLEQLILTASRFRGALWILGGDSQFWSLPPSFEYFANRVKETIEAAGQVTVPLETYAAKFEKANDGWHFSATEGNLRSWASTTASMVECMLDFNIPPDWLYGDYGSWEGFCTRRLAQYDEIQQEARESLKLVDARLAADDYFNAEPIDISESDEEGAAGGDSGRSKRNKIVLKEAPGVTVEDSEDEVILYAEPTLLTGGRPFGTLTNKERICTDYRSVGDPGPSFLERPAHQVYKEMSRALTLLLRHKADQLGALVRRDGFVPLSGIVPILVECNTRNGRGDLHWVESNRYGSFKLTERMVIDTAVRSWIHDKRRFQLLEEQGDDGTWRVTFIRASNGHSMECCDSVYSEGDLLNGNIQGKPGFMIHGTRRAVWRDIIKGGLLAGGPRRRRALVHCSPFPQNDSRCVAGMRYDAEVSIYIDPQQFMREGNLLYESASGALLCGDVPAKYILLVVDNASNTEIWNRDFAAKQLGDMGYSLDGSMLPGWSAQEGGQPQCPKGFNCNTCSATLLFGQMLCHRCGHIVDSTDDMVGDRHPRQSAQRAAVRLTENDRTLDLRVHKNPRSQQARNRRGLEKARKRAKKLGFENLEDRLRKDAVFAQVTIKESKVPGVYALARYLLRLGVLANFGQRARGTNVTVVSGNVHDPATAYDSFLRIPWSLLVIMVLCFIAGMLLQNFINYVQAERKRRDNSKDAKIAELTTIMKTTVKTKYGHKNHHYADCRGLKTASEPDKMTVTEACQFCVQRLEVALHQLVKHKEE